jgi:hypothetical protein
MAATDVQSATLSLYDNSGTGDLYVHQLCATAVWNTFATFNTYNGTADWPGYSGASPGQVDASCMTDTQTMVSAAPGWVTVDVTAIVRNWLNGQANNGVVVQSFSSSFGFGSTTAPLLKFASSESSTNSPKLDITRVTVPTQSTVVETRTSRLNTTPNEQAGDYVLQNGSVHVNGNVYKKITLSGTVSNWTGFTPDDWSGGVWGFISLMGTDYFANRQVPADVDETMISLSTFPYLGNEWYGDVAKQCAFAANAGIVMYKDTTSLPAFAAEDCADAPTTSPGHKVEMGNASLTNTNGFEFELVYDLAAQTMIAKIRDAGDTSWDMIRSISIGLRNDGKLLEGSEFANDDWSDLVFSMQMSNNLLPSYTTTYGFNYTVKIAVGDMLSGDANFDGKVDVGDLGILAANYGSSGKNWNQGDFNGDGAVDVGDLGILAANYGTGSSSGADYDADYAKVFGTATESATEDSTTDDSDNSICSSLGLSLIAGLALMGLMLVKLEE